MREEARDGKEGRSLQFAYTAEPIRGERRIETITGPMSLRIDYEYDEFANLVKVTRATKVEQYEYTVPPLPPGETSYPLEMVAELDLHNLSAVIDANEHRTEYVYYTREDEFPGEGDALSYGKFEWVKEVREAVGTEVEATTSFVYDLTELASTGRFTTHVTDPRLKTTIYRLNANGSPLEIEEPGGILTVMEWAADDYLQNTGDRRGRTSDGVWLRCQRQSHQRDDKKCLHCRWVPITLWRRVGPLVGGAQGRDRSFRRALAGPLRLSRPALDSGVSRARVAGSGGSRCRVPVCLIRQAIAMAVYHGP